MAYTQVHIWCPRERIEQMITEITTTARRIARRINGHQAMGGFCLFSADGRGGSWYAENAHPPMRDDDIKMRVPHTRITARDVQAIIDGQLDENR